jgi:hypothetical protein
MIESAFCALELGTPRRCKTALGQFNGSKQFHADLNLWDWKFNDFLQFSAASYFKGSDQWEGRGCRRSPNHYMFVGEVVLDVFLSF